MSFSLDRSTHVLQRTPASLRALLAGLDEAWTHANYGPDTFSPFDVVGHLIHAERTNWMPRARTILELGESEPLPAFDRYAMYEASTGKSIAELIDTFVTLRAASLDQ